MKISALFLICGVLSAQHAHTPGASKPAELAHGLGNHKHPIATSSGEAQRFFDQGLTLIFGFNHDEAARLFQRAAELDPKAAMPHWGIALALGPNINLPPVPEREKAAWEALQRAQSLAAGAPEHERRYIAALTTRYSADPRADRQKLAAAYREAMRELARDYPDDLDAAALYAESIMNLRPWQLWTPDGKPAEGTEEAVATLESVMRRDPQHVGANHYYIHAVEASKTPERALASAERLRTLVPAAGHLVHMPGHIYMQLGDFDAAASTNEAAAKADRDYIQRTQAKGMYPAMYYSHNLHFIAYARAMQGRFAEARKAAAELAANVRPVAREMPMVESFLPFEYTVLVRFRRWDDILGLSRPNGALPLATAMWHWSRAVSWTGRGKVKEAEGERELFQSVRKRVPVDANFGLNPAWKVLELADAELAARLAGARRDAAAVDLWTRAVALQDALAYDEPPSWYYPLRESLGGALLRAGRAGDAERVFREDLERNPRNGRSLFGYLESLKAQKKESRADWVRRQFESSWKTADTQLRVDEL